MASDAKNAGGDLCAEERSTLIVVTEIWVGEGDTIPASAGDGWQEKKVKSGLVHFCAGREFGESCAFEEKTAGGDKAMRAVLLEILEARNSLGEK